MVCFNQVEQDARVGSYPLNDSELKKIRATNARLPSRKLTAKTLEKMPAQKYSPNHQFSLGFAVSFREGNFVHPSFPGLGRILNQSTNLLTISKPFKLLDNHPLNPMLDHSIRKPTSSPTF